MTRVYAILALSVALAAAGCQSSPMGSDQTGSDRGFGSNNPGNTNPTSTNLNTPTVAGTPNDATSNYNNYQGSGASNSYGNGNTQNMQGAPKNNLGFGISNNDLNFMKDAHSANLFEISSSNQAVAKSTDQQIKSFAQHMIDDHNRADNQLTTLAARKGAGSLGPISQDKADQLAQLDKLNGSDFDREYLRLQRAAHEETISKFQAATTSVQDADIREFASSTLPTLRDHLNMVNARWNAMPGVSPDVNNQNINNQNLNGNRPDVNVPGSNRPDTVRPDTPVNPVTPGTPGSNQ